MPKVSIIVPAYNEAKYIVPLLEKIQAIDLKSVGFEKEIIVVDDGSSDGTHAAAGRVAGVKVFRKLPNEGKGRAVQFGIAQATGDYVLVQDADLEYDPRDYLPMLKELGKGGKAAVYGSRVMGRMREESFSMLPGKHPNQGFGPYLAGMVLSLWTLLLYGRYISDTLTAYKIYPRSLFEGVKIVTHGFETDHEITARLVRMGYEIYEVPISYEPRSRAEGKKIRAIDGLIALWTLLKFRFT